MVILTQLGKVVDGGMDDTMRGSNYVEVSQVRGAAAAVVPGENPGLRAQLGE